MYISGFSLIVFYLLFQWLRRSEVQNVVDIANTREQIIHQYYQNNQNLDEDDNDEDDNDEDEDEKSKIPEVPSWKIMKMMKSKNIEQISFTSSTKRFGTEKEYIEIQFNSSTGTVEKLLHRIVGKKIIELAAIDCSSDDEFITEIDDLISTLYQNLDAETQLKESDIIQIPECEASCSGK